MNKNNKDKYYLDKDDLWDAISEYYTNDDANREAGGDGIVMSNKLGQMILDICANITTAKCFSGYPFRAEMEGDAYYRIVYILTKRKFSLYSPETCYTNKVIKFKGWSKTKKCEELLEKHPEYKFIPNIPTEDESTFDLSDEILIVKPRKNKIYKDVEGNNQVAYQRVELERGLFERKEGSEVETLCKDKENVFICKDGVCTASMLKNNPFGYLSIIAKREAITRLKRENKNYNTIHVFQEQEFTKFLSDNPEMAPQKIDDDTYKIMDN